jgi:excisionase family DNA binding protein
MTSRRTPRQNGGPGYGYLQQPARAAGFVMNADLMTFGETPPRHFDRMILPTGRMGRVLRPHLSKGAATPLLPRATERQKDGRRLVVMSALPSRHLRDPGWIGHAESSVTASSSNWGRATVAEQQDRLFTAREVAELFGVDPKTVVRWAVNGRLPSIRTPGGHLRFRRSDVLRVLHRPSD